NRMSDEMQAKLAAYIEREGLVEPIVVRRIPGEEDRYQILGGFHRWRICKERLGYATMPCGLVDVDHRRGRSLSVKLNEMSGQAVPALMANLLADLNREISVDDLETLLPYSRLEMEDMLKLLRLPEGLEARLEEEARRQEEEQLVIVSVALTQEQNALF